MVMVLMRFVVSIRMDGHRGSLPAMVRIARVDPRRTPQRRDVMAKEEKAEGLGWGVSGWGSNRRWRDLQARPTASSRAVQ